MSDKLRIKIAAAVTALFLAAVSAAGVIAHSSRLPAATATVTQRATTVESHAASQPNLAPPLHDQEHD